MGVADGCGVAVGDGLASGGGKGIGVGRGVAVCVGGFTGGLEVVLPEVLFAPATALRTAATNDSAPRGESAAPVRMVLKGTKRPYNSRVASSSCVIEEPFNVTPANNPRARE